MKKYRKMLVEKLKKEIENAPFEKVGMISANIIFEGSRLGLTKKDLDKLKVTFNKRLQKMALP